MIQPTFRSLSNGDVPAIYALALEAWRYTYKNIFDIEFIESYVRLNYAPERLIRLLPRIQNGEMFFYVALCEAQIVGFCNIGTVDQSAQLFRIYLSPEYIGQGIGRKLLAYGEAFIIDNGMQSYFCFVHKNNEIGKSFYLKNSFCHIAEKDHEDEWYMEKSIVVNPHDAR